VVCQEKNFASVLAGDLLEIIPRELALSVEQC